MMSSKEFDMEIYIAIAVTANFFLLLLNEYGNLQRTKGLVIVMQRIEGKLKEELRKISPAPK
tara:strand:+ start:13839 stop:14024 length:186 start_codon:yes stop_codon:yes gene_type:complete